MVPLLVGAVLCSCVRLPTVRVVAAGEGPGRIEGIVISQSFRKRYEDGRPAKGTTVSAFPLDRELVAKVPSADTDELGRSFVAWKV